MTRVRCVNKDCEATERIFDVNNADYLEPGGQFVKPRTPSAVSVLVKCPKCGADNRLWAIGVKHDVSIAREI